MASFKYAFQGVKQLFRNEPNAWIHAFVAVGVVIAGFLLQLAIWEWIVVIILIGIVFAAEAFNSAVEALSDAVSPDYNLLIKQAKDLSAAAVLISALAAAIIGILIFGPKIWVLF